MSTFLFVIACIVWFLAAAAMVMALIGFVFGIGDGNWALGEGIIAFIAWLAGAALLICIPIWTGVFTEDDMSGHCGPGTVYRESSHYNAATKTTDTDWWCEAK